MKYLMYFLLPCSISYKILYEIMGLGLFVITNYECYDRKTYIEYDEYKRLNRESKLKYLSLYIKNNKVLSFIDKNIMKIISSAGSIVSIIYKIINLL